MNNTDNRNVSLDSIGGLLLIYMIIMHCAIWSDVFSTFSMYTQFLGFFMPWFFFKGGMFYRPLSLAKDIKKGYKRLIIPFIYFSIIGTLILWCQYALDGVLNFKRIIMSIGSVILYGSFPGNLALWFLVSLFVVRIIFNLFFNRITPQHSQLHNILWGGGITILCISFIPLYFIRLKYQIFIPYYFFNISSGLSFYTCGYLLKKFSPNINILLLITTGYILSIIFFSWSIDMRTGNTSNILLFIPYAILGIITFNNWGGLIFKKPNILSKIGKDTMPYYCMHWCIIEIVALFFPNSKGPDFIYFGCLVLANIILLPIFTKLIYRSRYKFIFQPNK